MGISTSAAALVVFAALFVALGTLATSGSNAIERLGDAGGAQLAHDLAIRATSFNVTNASYNFTAGVYTLEAENTGERPIDVSKLSVVADARFVPRSAFETVTVAGRDSRVWRPGQRLRLQDTDDSITGLLGGSVADHVTLVTGDGVARLSEVRQYG